MYYSRIPHTNCKNNELLFDSINGALYNQKVLWVLSSLSSDRWYMLHLTTFLNYILFLNDNEKSWAWYIFHSKHFFLLQFLVFSFPVQYLSFSIILLTTKTQWIRSCIDGQQFILIRRLQEKKVGRKQLLRCEYNYLRIK